jgi:hypothetical protein
LNSTAFAVVPLRDNPARKAKNRSISTPHVVIM